MSLEELREPKTSRELRDEALDGVARRQFNKPSWGDLKLNEEGYPLEMFSDYEHMVEEAIKKTSENCRKEFVVTLKDLRKRVWMKARSEEVDMIIQEYLPAYVKQSSYNKYSRGDKPWSCATP
jgi:hypothetical protein